MWPNLLYKLLAYLLILWSPLLSVLFTYLYSPKLVAQKYEKYSQKKKKRYISSLCEACVDALQFTESYCRLYDFVPHFPVLCFLMRRRRAARRIS